MVTARHSPRALKLPVGFKPSSLMKTFFSRRLGSMGVKPSPRETGATSGNTSRYRQRDFSRPARDSRRKFFFIAARSWMSYRAPASLGQTVCGDAAESSKPHLEQRRQEMFFILWKN